MSLLDRIINFRKLQIGETIDSYGNIYNAESWYTALSRSTFGENHIYTCEYMKKIVDDIDAEIRSNPSNVEITNLIPGTITALENYKETCKSRPYVKYVNNFIGSQVGKLNSILNIINKVDDNSLLSSKEKEFTEKLQQLNDLEMKLTKKGEHLCCLAESIEGKEISINEDLCDREARLVEREALLETQIKRHLMEKEEFANDLLARKQDTDIKISCRKKEIFKEDMNLKKAWLSFEVTKLEEDAKLTNSRENLLKDIEAFEREKRLLQAERITIEHERNKLIHKQKELNDSIMRREAIAITERGKLADERDNLIREITEVRAKSESYNLAKLQELKEENLKVNREREKLEKELKDGREKLEREIEEKQRIMDEEKNNFKQLVEADRKRFEIEVNKACDKIELEKKSLIIQLEELRNEKKKFPAKKTENIVPEHKKIVFDVGNSQKYLMRTQRDHLEVLVAQERRRLEEETLKKDYEV